MAKIQLVPIGIIVLAVLIGIIVYDETNDKFQSEFSVNLKKWHEKGEYFTYKNIYKLFYIYEKLTGVKKTSKSEPKPPVLLFLHGFPSSSFDYHKIWYQLLDKNNKFPINEFLTFDYLGYGFSDKPFNYEYSIFDMADMVDRLLMYLNIESVIIVAHDIGDTVVQEILRRDNLKNQNNFKVVKCILLNGGVVSNAYEPQLSQLAFRSSYVGPVISSNYFFRFLFFKQAFIRVFGNLNRPNTTELYDHYLTIRYNNGNKVLPLTINYLSEREQYGNIWYDALNETALPILFIYGPADPVNLRSKFPQQLRTDIPKVKLSILSELVGHYPHLEDYFTVFQLILKFIQYKN